MAFRYREPLRSDYDTDEEYEAAIEAYESAMDDYCERYLEERRQ